MEKFHFIGIKGAGMSSLACLLHDYGYSIQGSDTLETFFTMKPLEERKIPIYPFNIDNIKKDFTVIVGNAFINQEEHQKAEQIGCKVYTYYEYLGKLSKKLYSVAITGSHGKTTTTNIIRQILGTKEPINYLIGDGQGAGSKESDVFVFEACEYQRHFLYYFPKVAVITNIDFDHPDYYKDINDVSSAFQQFIKQSEICIYNGDDLLLKNVISQHKKSVSYGLNKNNQYYAEQIHNDSNYTYFDLYIDKEYQTQIKIPLFGLHSVYNTLAAIATTQMLIDDLTIIKDALANFKKGKRRFEEVFINNQVIISDYAHHPKEIKATIEAAMCKYPYKKIYVYFQPHTYTRTITFLKDFAESLSLAEKVYLREIFSSAREKDKIVSVNDLSKLIKNSEVINDQSYIETFKALKDAVILFMGAGDIDQYCNQYIDALKNNEEF